jgi:hypothetical protein
MPKTSEPTSQKKIIIEGVTEQGEQFRPGDWAERMSGSLCTFSSHRIVYSPLLQPMVKGGNKCVLLDPALKESNPALYEEILEFARVNKLKMGEENGESSSDEKK